MRDFCIDFQHCDMGVFTLAKMVMDQISSTREEDEIFGMCGGSNALKADVFLPQKIFCHNKMLFRDKRE